MAASNVGILAGGDGRGSVAASFVGVADEGGRALPRAGGRTLAAAGGALAGAGSALAGVGSALAGAGSALAGADGALAEASTVGRVPTVVGCPPAGELRTATNIAIRTISSCDKLDERTVARSVATPSHLGMLA